MLSDFTNNVNKIVGRAQFCQVNIRNSATLWSAQIHPFIFTFTHFLSSMQQICNIPGRVLQLIVSLNWEVSDNSKIRLRDPHS